jgi:hypothetical protein
VSAAVYVWEWSLDTPPKFIRTLVPKRDHSETLEEARPGEARYDSFCNEWTLCAEWVDELYEESDEETDEVEAQELRQDEEGVSSSAGVSPAHDIEFVSITSLASSAMATTPAPTTFPLSHPVAHTPLGVGLTPFPYEEWEQSQLDVLGVLKKYYGFLPPVLPTKFGHLAQLVDIKILLAITGTCSVKINSALWTTPMGYACIDFGLHLASKEGSEPPSAVWDLSSRCRDPLKFSSRLCCIKRVRAGTQCGRAALLRSGYVRRLALDSGMSISEALKGPSGLHYNNALNFCAWDKDGVEYVDDDLTTNELDLLCGIYQSFTGMFYNIISYSFGAKCLNQVLVQASGSSPGTLLSPRLKAVATTKATGTLAWKNFM